ncbi:hypothetical protein FRB91_011540 [Serendipita sp. 411]|nr:hypothetical protein FRC16_009495 [Serendipita sp. 398]KAG8827290.1 hypothetical protein FRC19_004496 [Serendipita sp. 401]KAG8839361.1 hypothetical protein FRC18_011472 [Serendipita sp. 400]KAG8847665.1 hypothetical protein FRB91_011540 [Serendipita sp. 411]KAG9057837.1 hypothetical protein FS842_003599 [Serendipita sp. 407]
MTPAEAKAALAVALGANAGAYWKNLADFLQGKTSRAEFEDFVTEHLNTAHLKQLHNNLLMEIITAACTTEPDTLTTSSIIPTNKRKRVHPYQGTAEDGETFHSRRLKQWIVGLSKSERQEVLRQGSYAEIHPREQRLRLEEVRQVKGYEIDAQRTLPNSLVLCSFTRALPSLTDLHDRLKATTMEHGLTINPSTSRTFARLFNQALEDFLVKIITATLTTITRSDSRYESIQAPAIVEEQSSFMTAKNSSKKVTISIMSLATTLHITPSLLPFPSPSVLKVMMREFKWPDENDDTASNKGQKGLILSAKPLSDYYRLFRAARSGGPIILSEYATFQ